MSGEKEEIRLVYRLSGSGTREFSSYRAGDGVSLLGVLGNGFPLDVAEGKRVALLGGGSGIPPLLA
jgi:dihydroorotate dehydrogenase electron transfer subunit